MALGIPATVDKWMSLLRFIERLMPVQDLCPLTTCALNAAATQLASALAAQTADSLTESGLTFAGEQHQHIISLHMSPRLHAVA